MTGKNNRQGRLLSLVLIIAGCVALLVSAVLFIGRIAEQKKTEARLSELAQQIEELLPKKTDGSIEERGDYTMPVLEIDGYDFAGLLEIEAYGIKLPIFAVWQEHDTAKRPAVYMGSVYNGSLIIGGRNTEKQFSFISRLSGGEKISFTDVQGRVFFYTVSAVKHSENINAEILTDSQYALTLFVRVNGAYLIARCN